MFSPNVDGTSPAGVIDRSVATDVDHATQGAGEGFGGGIAIYATTFRAYRSASL